MQVLSFDSSDLALWWEGIGFSMEFGAREKGAEEKLREEASGRIVHL